MVTETAIKVHPRARRRAETVVELLDHAERVVLAEGLEALSMHRLAAEHGVRVAALYRYWPSKDALLSALLERAVLRLREAVEGIAAEEAEILSHAPRSEEELSLFRLVRLSALYFRMARERPEITSLIGHFLAPARTVLEPAPDSQLLSNVMWLVTETAGAFVHAAAVSALRPGEPTQRAALLWTSLQGLVGSAKLTRFGIGGGRPALERALLETLFLGFGAEHALLSHALDSALSD